MFPSNEENFYGLLKVYLATEGRRFVHDIRFNANFTRIIVSNFWRYPNPIPSLEHIYIYCDFKRFDKQCEVAYPLI